MLYLILNFLGKKETQKLKKKIKIKPIAAVAKNADIGLLLWCLGSVYKRGYTIYLRFWGL